jgi:hypothetical protein
MSVSEEDSVAVAGSSHAAVVLRFAKLHFLLDVFCTEWIFRIYRTEAL